VGAALDLVDLAWGEQTGYVCLSIRNPKLTKEDTGYWKDLTFKWPEERSRVSTALDKAKHAAKDVYWAPAVFQTPKRSRDISRVHTLWADLDEVEPTNIPKHLKPTAIWESSPSRYQALWLMDTPLPPESQQTLNQKLSYALGADRGGWDLTQVLRIPDTHNHKYMSTPLVKLMHLNGHTITPARLLDDLPELTQPKQSELPDPEAIITKHKKYFNARIKELMRARHATVGSRSDRLWELECLLAERSLVAEEIAAIVQRTVWNKFKGRNTEVSQLLTEAKKAIEHIGPIGIDVVDETVFEEIEEVKPIAWRDFDRVHEPLDELVADIWGAHEVGFISGLPKSYKSWIALDLAVSLATGTRFLGSFQAKKRNVLVIQEEDPRPTLQDRLAKVAASKGLIQVDLDNLTFDYDLPENLFVISNQGFVIDEDWLELLEGWITDQKIEVVIMDPLMMIAAAGFDEFKAFDFMAKVLKPLKRLRARTGAAIVVVHHHLKASTAGGARDMYGSVALWAWEESAMHLQVTGPQRITIERFSKNKLLGPLQVEFGDLEMSWQPEVIEGKAQSLIDLLSSYEAGAAVDELVGVSGRGREAVIRQLKKLEEEGKVTRGKDMAQSQGRKRDLWKVISTPQSSE
jgi:hypothetical protein